MIFFDPCVHADARSDDDLANLAWFGTERIVICAQAPRRFERAEKLLAYFERLLGAERRRAESLGLEAQVALGVHPRAAPRRTFHEVWRELPSLLSEPGVVALGEVGIWEATSREYGLLEHQLRLAHELGDLPCIVRVPTMNRRAVLRQVMACQRRSGLPVDRVVLVVHQAGAQATLLDEAQGCRLVLVPDPAAIREPGWSAWSSRLGRHRVMLSSGLVAGPADVLAVNRAALALADAGMSPASVERWVYGNARDLFG